MDGMKAKVLFGSIFVILSFLLMVGDGLFHIDFKSRPSPTVTHVIHEGMNGNAEHGDMVEKDMEEMEMEGMDMSGPQKLNEKLKYLPKRSPENSIQRLSYVEKDGVKEYYLTVDEVLWEYKEGKYVHVWAYNGQIPGPEIRVKEGDRVRVIVKNNLPVPTTIHWHGVDVENKADGVPGFTQFPIKPGETYNYEYTAKPSGTRFYHSHGSKFGDSVTQVDMGLTGPLIIEPKLQGKKYDREYIYLLDEWEIDYDGSNAAFSGLGDVHIHESAKTNYNTFTVNGRVFPDIEPLMVKEGETVLLRLINVGTQEMHPMHTHGHSFKVVAIDGNIVPEVAQQMRDVITVHPAERYDIEIVADNPGAWLFHCHHLHHAAAGMTVAFLYEGFEPCCLGEEEEIHAKEQIVNECFGHHVDDYVSTLKHCQEDICGLDSHCFEEIEVMSQKFK